MLGIKDAFVPFTPFMNCPVILAVGEIVRKPVVKDDQIVIAPMVNLNFTVDHRYIDGGKSKGLLDAIYKVFDKPNEF
jgi:pyruvate/2-oxoglutarate dehydrogenase complex dihydrolipoamide acyltransferase (E2) component